MLIANSDGRVVNLAEVGEQLSLADPLVTIGVNLLKNLIHAVLFAEGAALYAGFLFLHIATAISVNSLEQGTKILLHLSFFCCK